MRALLLGAALAALALALLEGAPRWPYDLSRPRAARAERAKAQAQPAERPSEKSPTPKAPSLQDPPGLALPPTLPPSPAERGVHPLSADLDTLRAALRSIGPLAHLAAEFVPFEASDVDAALERGGRSRASIALWTFQPSAFAWRPAADREQWVLSGRAGAHAVLAVLERKGDRLEHAASLLIDERDATIAIGYSEREPAELIWTTCHGCAGEGGTIRSRDDGRIEIAYR